MFLLLICFVFIDGYTVVSKFTIANGKVTHEKKVLQSDAYKRAMASGKPCISEYGTKAFSVRMHFCAHTIYYIIISWASKRVGFLLTW